MLLFSTLPLNPGSARTPTSFPNERITSNGSIANNVNTGVDVAATTAAAHDHVTGNTSRAACKEAVSIQVQGILVDGLVGAARYNAYEPAAHLIAFNENYSRAIHDVNPKPGKIHTKFRLKCN